MDGPSHLSALSCSQSIDDRSLVVVLGHSVCGYQRRGHSHALFAACLGCEPLDERVAKFAAVRNYEKQVEITALREGRFPPGRNGCAVGGTISTR